MKCFINFVLCIVSNSCDLMGKVENCLFQVYAASRRLLPPEQRHALDVATGLFAFAAAAYLLQA